MIIRPNTVPAVLVTGLALLAACAASAQDCSPEVPVFTVDMSADANMTWTSPLVVRDGNCCGTSSPDRCVAFVITLHPEAEGIIFDICDGAVSPGAMFYQVNCGPQVEVGQALCLDGAGPHYLTFCKPGNNDNAYCITSISEPTVSPDITLGYSCDAPLQTWGFDPLSVTWNSVSPGAPGQYNSYLSCTACTTTNVISTVSQPVQIVYEACGIPYGGCEVMDTCLYVAVQLYPPLTVVLNPAAPVVCWGETTTPVSALPSGGSGQYTYQWSNGATGASTDLPPGPAWVEVSDGTGCNDYVLSFVVGAVTIQPLANAGADQVLCDGGGPVNLSGSVNGAPGGIWSGGAGAWSAAPNSLPNTYLPTAAEYVGGVMLYLTTAPSGTCPAHTDSVWLQPGVLPGAMALGVQHVSCAGGANGALSVLGIPPGIALQFDWSIPGVATTSSSVSGLGGGSYSVVLTDANGCFSTLTATVSEPPPLILAEVLQQPITCSGASDGTLMLEVAGGSPPYECYLSSPSSIFTGTLITSIPPGSYTAQVVDINNCQVQQPVLFADPPVLQAQLTGAATICPGETAQLIVTATGGTGDLTYIWNQGLTDQPAHLVGPSASAMYQVVVEDENGCSVGPLLAHVHVHVLTTSGLTMESSVGICEGDVGLVTATFDGNYGPYSFQWNEGLGNQPGSYYVDPQQPTWYTFTVYDVCGHVLQDSVFLDVYDIPDIDLPGNLGQGCMPHTVDFGELLPDYAGATWNWSFGDGFFSYSANPLYTYESPGTFHVGVTMTTADGCVANSASNATVNVFASPDADIIASPQITTLSNSTITFMNGSSSDDVSNEWYFGGDAFTMGQIVEYTYDDTGTFVVSLNAVNAFGCASQAQVVVIVQPEYDLIIPNIFTPNPEWAGDGYWDPNSLTNDIFYPFTEYVEEFEMYIFNRWGELIFFSDDIRKGWNGYYRGELCLQDVYAYRVKVTHTDGRVQSRLGEITLLR